MKPRSTAMPGRTVENGGLKRGEVRAVRELRDGVQCVIALGYTPDLGSASCTVVITSLEARQKMAELKEVLAREGLRIVEGAA